MDNAKANAMFDKVKKRAKGKPAPVPQGDQASRGDGLVPMAIMEEVIKVNFDSIHQHLESCEEELKADMKSLFDHYITDIDQCGEMVFTATDYDTLNEQFSGIQDEDQ